MGMGENSHYGSGGGKSTNGSSHGHGNNSSNAIWSPSVRHAQRGHDNVGNEQERDRSDRSILILSSFSSSNSNNTGSASNNKLYMDFFEDREGAGGMRVGRDYQAKIPPLTPKEDRNPQAEPEKALLIWCPSDRITDEQVEHYLSIAHDKFQYSGEQALGLLFWHRYDVNRALQDLGNFTPNPEEWTIEDKVLFEQAYQFHGKAFDRIRSMLPDKSMSNLIRYYYKWKKLRCKTSVMDRQVKKFQEDSGDDQNAPPVSGSIISQHNSQQQQGNLHQNYHQNLASGSSSLRHQNASDSDSDDKGSSASWICGNCGVPVTELHSKDNKESMCKTCFLYWKKTGEARPLTGPMRRGDRQLMGLGCVRQRRTPPKGMFLNHDDLQLLASAPPQAENVTLQSLEKEVHDVQCRVQFTKQGIEMLKSSLLPPPGTKAFHPTEASTGPTRVTSRWSQDELLLAAQGVRRFGKNFQKIAEVMGTKSEAHLRTFYANYRKRYGLDSLVKEHENEQLNLDDLANDINSGASPASTSSSCGSAIVAERTTEWKAVKNNGPPIKRLEI